MKIVDGMHNPKVAGSNPAPATIKTGPSNNWRPVFFFEDCFAKILPGRRIGFSGKINLDSDCTCWNHCAQYGFWQKLCNFAFCCDENAWSKRSCYDLLSFIVNEHGSSEALLFFIRLVDLHPRSPRHDKRMENQEQAAP